MKKLLTVFCAVLAAAAYSESFAAGPSADGESSYSASALCVSGNNIAMAFFDGSVRLFDPSSSRMLFSLSAHSKPSACLASDRMGKYILSYSSDGGLALINARNGKITYRSSGMGGSFPACAVSPEGKYSFAAGRASVHVFNNDTWERVNIWEGFSEGVYSIAVSFDGKLAAVGGRSGKIGLYSVPEGKLIKFLQAGRETVSSLAFAEGSDILVSGSYESPARVWDASKGEIIKELSGSPARFAAVSKYGGYVLTGGNGQMVLWDLEKNLAETYFSGSDNEDITAVAADPALRFIAAGIGAQFQKEKLVKIWYPSNKRQSRDVFAFGNAFAVISNLGYISGSGDFGKYIKVYEGGKSYPYADKASKYNKSERLQIDLGKGPIP